MCFAIHPPCEHDERKQTRLSSSYGEKLRPPKDAPLDKLYPFREESNHVRCMLLSLIALGSHIILRRSKVRLSLSSNTRCPTWSWPYFKCHSDGKFGAMMNVSLTNEVSRTIMQILVIQHAHAHRLRTGTSDFHNRFSKVWIPSAERSTRNPYRKSRRCCTWVVQHLLTSITRLFFYFLTPLVEL